MSYLEIVLKRYQIDCLLYFSFLFLYSHDDVSPVILVLVQPGLESFLGLVQEIRLCLVEECMMMTIVEIYDLSDSAWMCGAEMMFHLYIQW